MLVIHFVRSASREFGRLPLLTRVGLALAVAAFVADVLVHLSPAPHHHGGGFRPEEHLAHLAGLAAMSIALLGVVIDGVRRQREHRRRTGAPEGGPRHAHR
jgi:hypothetical protein